MYVCKFVFCVHTFFFFFSIQMELSVAWIRSAYRAQWTAVFETWLFYYGNALSCLLEELVLLMSFWLSYNWQLPKTRCLPAFEFQNCAGLMFAQSTYSNAECVKMGDRLWHQLPGTVQHPDYSTGGSVSAWNTTPRVSMFWGQQLQ